jgi:hypothetical protein
VALQEATELLQKHFSTIILLIYILVVPITCLILYLLVNGGARTTIEIMSLILWISGNVGVMMYYTIPAFSLDEQVGRKMLDLLLKIE